MPLIDREVANLLLSAERRMKELARAREAVRRATGLNTQQLIEAWVVIGECYKLNRNSEPAEEAYLKAVEIIRSLGDEKLLGEGYKALGDALQFDKVYNRAITYYEQSVEIFKRLNETVVLIDTLSQMAYCLEGAGQREKERHSLEIAISEPGIAPVIRATLLERIALSLAASGIYDEAITVYEKALVAYESEGFKRFWEERVRNLAQLYNTVGDTEAVKRTLERI